MHITNRSIPDFIVIDDDPISNIICHKLIRKVFPSAGVETFTDPMSGLEHIRRKYEDPAANKAFLFLDINMPGLNGWGVLERFVTFSNSLKQNFTISLLSSSVAIRDKQLAAKNPLVSGYIEKPLSIPHLKQLFPDM